MNSPVNILIVDDETRNLEALESVLGGPDYRFVRASTAEEALLHLIDGEFAVIVLDIRMPGMSGIELANLIKQRKRTQHIPIIFLTAYFQEDKDVLAGYGIGAVDYLTKPVNPQILKSKIEVFADLFRKTRALATSNASLEQEVIQRRQAEEALQHTNSELEARVLVRTMELSRANQELRERELVLRANALQAKAMSRAKDDFLAALSHELRTPLNPVLLVATEAASNTKLPLPIRADFEMIAKNVALEARLIDDLLDLTQITRGKLSLDRRPVDVHVSLQEALAMVRGEIEQKRITLEQRLHAGRHMVWGDDVRLKQVFWNVLKNAAKFTPQSGRIMLETALVGDGNELVVSVSDTGIGMTEPELARIFEAFAQGDHAADGGNHRFGGLGLGLAISRRMVELHEGSITADSRGRDQGTTMRIRLPLLTAAVPELPMALPPAPAVQPVPAVAGDERRRRILLVEDHQPTALALNHLLTRRNYTVVVAGCVADARAAAEREEFDLLISDIGLPDGSGHDLMSELHGRTGLTGIALTGYGMEEDLNRSHAAGFASHLTKPVSAQALDRALVTAPFRSSGGRTASN